MESAEGIWQEKGAGPRGHSGIYTHIRMCEDRYPSAITRLLDGPAVKGEMPQDGLAASWLTALQIGIINIGDSGHCLCPFHHLTFNKVCRFPRPIHLRQH